MSQALKRPILLLSLMLVVGTHPAIAQIAGTAVSLPERPSGRNSVAFDSVNQVYLVSLAGSGTVVAKFVSKTGAQIGSVFSITAPGEAPYIGWVGVSFGGTPADPTFLVTYVATNGGSSDHLKYGRLVRYNAGQPVVGARSFITYVGSEWPSAEKAQAAWTGEQFIVGTRIPVVATPQPEVRTFDLAGNVSSPVIIGDYLDYYGSPAIACATDGVCLVSGYANGIPFGGAGGTYARLVYGRTLQPLTGMFYLDDHSGRMENQNVVFNSQTGEFLAAWWRGPTSNVDTRVVGHDGVLQPLNHPTVFAGVAGDIVLSYNAGTGTAILTSKNAFSNVYGLFAVELDATGLIPNPNNQVLVTAWDGVWPEFTPAIAANSTDRQWLALAVQTSGGRAVLIQGGSTAPPPAPSCTSSLSTTNISVMSPGATLSVGVVVPSSCSWTASSSVSWVQISQNATPTGSGNIGVTVQRNTSSSGRTGSVLIAGQSVTVQQAGFNSAATSDLDGDGYSDIVWQHQPTGALSWWRLQNTSVIYGGALPTPSDPSWKLVGSGDLNGDSRSDLVLQKDGTVVVWLWTLSGYVGIETAKDVDPHWRIRGVGDLNGDGNADIVWQHDTVGWVAVWFMSGPNVISAMPLTVPQQPNLSWLVVGAGDINGDGIADILWQNQSTGVLGAWLMRGAQVIGMAALSLYTPDLNWKVMGVGDVNGDGFADLLWENIATGQLQAWTLYGYSIVSTNYILSGSTPAVVDTNWRMVGPG